MINENNYVFRARAQYRRGKHCLRDLSFTRAVCGQLSKLHRVIMHLHVGRIDPLRVTSKQTSRYVPPTDYRSICVNRKLVRGALIITTAIRKFRAIWQSGELLTILVGGHPEPFRQKDERSSGSN